MSRRSVAGVGRISDMGLTLESATSQRACVQSHVADDRGHALTHALCELAAPRAWPGLRAVSQRAAIRDALGELWAGRYQVEALAGRGGMSVVFQARDRRSRRRVALKQFLPHVHPRWTREAELLRGVRHPAVMQYLAHGVNPRGEPFAVMEWLQGETLAERLERGPLSVRETLHLLARVAGGLAAIHEREWVHRDVKPSNIVLVGGRVERATLIDFGVVLPRLRGAARGQHLRPIVGTRGYMPPEQALGAYEQDARVDVFALGCVAYACLTGVEALPASSHSDVVHDGYQTPTRPRALRSEVPRGLEALVMEMLAIARQQRPRDGAAVLRRLAGLHAAGEAQLRDSSVRACRPQAGSDTPPERMRRMA